MSPFLQLAVALAVIIAATKFGGYISYRLGQPSVLGEILVGIILGPSVLNFLHFSYFSDEHLGEIIHELAELGVLLLMFIAGLELHLSDLAKSGRVAAIAGMLGVVVPLLLGAGVGIAFGMEIMPAAFIGLILAATSVSISAQTLMELGVLRSRVGVTLLGAAVFDDILVVLGLSVFVAVVLSGGEAGIAEVLWIATRMVLFLVAGTVLGLWLLPRLSRRVSRLPISQGIIAFTIVVVLFYGWAAEVLGSMAAITGAFLAGVLLGRSPVKERIESGISALAYGMFVPIFFIDVGLSADARQLTTGTLWLMIVMTVVAVVGKVAGAGLGARLGGFSNLESLQLGVGMMSRGEVGLIVASVGIVEGIISQQTFAAIVGVVILTTVLTPPLLRMLFAKSKEAPSDERLVTEGE
ncbi:MAG TPA: cation:proton antiporter [Anaerolineales bacterium]|nr:cation:proton antiporter [Anaerolineales bacterium]